VLVVSVGPTDAVVTVDYRKGSNEFFHAAAALKLVGGKDW
jgi:hypothetical protein